MKKLLFLLFISLFFLLTLLPVSAKDANSDIVDSIEDELSDFKNSLPEYVLDFIPDEVFSGNFSLLLDKGLDEKKLWEYIIDYLFAGIGEVLKSFSIVLVLILISSIFETMSASFKNSSIRLAFSTCSSLSIGITVFNICVSLCQLTSSYINGLCQAMNAFAPIMASMQIMSGNISSATLSNAIMVLFISITESFLVVFMMPLVKICMMLSCAKSLGGIEFGGVSKVVRSTFTSVTIFVMSIFMFIFSFKNILTQDADRLSIKTARFAISSFVPMVGASINDALRTVSSSLSIIKNSCGVVAILVIALIMLPIIIYVFLNKLCFGLLGSISKTIDCGMQSAILEEADSLCTYMLTLIACTCTLFIFAITIFIKTTVEVGVWMVILSRFL